MFGADSGIRLAGTVWALSAPGSATNIFAVAGGTSVAPQASIQPQLGVDASVFRITVALGGGSVFNMTITDGTTTKTEALNGGTALAASSLYTFSVGVRKLSPAGNKLSYNFQVATNVAVDYLLVEEISGGVI
jgi:hypothetical protein